VGLWSFSFGICCGERELKIITPGDVSKAMNNKSVITRKRFAEAILNNRSRDFVSETTKITGRSNKISIFIDGCNE
jgi:hypothetical protein